MNGESSTSPRGNGESSSPFSSSDAQSPGLPHLHRHQYEDPMSAAGLRRRHGDHLSNDEGSRNDPRIFPDELLLHLRTPDFDSRPSRTMELVVPKAMSVNSLKDMIASDRGEAAGVVKVIPEHLRPGISNEDQSWVRHAMRLVWRGRIVKDDEILGEITSTDHDNIAHVFHLVATPANTPSATPAAPVRPAARTAHLSATQQAAGPSTITHAGSLPTPHSRNSIALQDSLHYLYFIARHHLCCLLGAKPLDWYDAVPPPVVSQSTAQDAVKSVIRGVAEPRAASEEGWEGWEGVFENIVVDVSASRSEVEHEIKGLLTGRLGRPWMDNESGNRITVELDEITYDLALPSLRKISDQHLANLAMYLRITSLIPMLIPVVEHESRRPTQSSLALTPTRTIPAPPVPPVHEPPLVRHFNGNAALDNFLRYTIRPIALLVSLLASIPRSVISHMAYSAVKIGAIMWMLCRDMKWGDVKFWILAGAAAGWWIGDGITVWLRERPRPAARQGGPAGQQGAGAGPGAGAGVAGRAGGRAGQPAGAGAGLGLPQMPTPPTFSEATSFMARAHLDIDAAQLGHPSSTSEPTTHPPARRTIPWIQSNLLLPIALWIITLIPEWETTRAREIRTRERSIRAIVRNHSRDTDVPNEGGDSESDPALRRAAYPEGLGFAALRYWDRVVSRTENIDWEEERDAQRAMGIPDEDARGGGGGDEMMRML